MAHSRRYQGVVGKVSTGHPLPYGRQSINEADIAAVVEALQSGWLTTGPAVGKFEGAFAARVGAPQAAACSNGTAAAHLAALALELGPGDHVIVPAITFLTTANAARFVGAEVIFADVDPLSGLMMPEHLEEAIGKAQGKQLKAVFPVHLGGQCADPAGIEKLGRRHGLHIVEDACHAVGTTYDAGGKTYRVGACAHSDLATFSFHPVKTMTTAEGGMVTGKDESLVGRVRLLRSHGMTRQADRLVDRGMGFEDDNLNPWYYEMSEIGFNYRLTDIQCALGISQLKRLDDFLARRSALVARYREALAGLAAVVQPVSQSPDCHPGWHLFAVLIDFEAIGLTRANLMRALSERGIASQVHYVPVNRQPYYRKRYGETDLPGADAYYSKCLSLPLFPDMTDSDVDRTAETLSSVIKRAA